MLLSVIFAILSLFCCPINGLINIPGTNISNLLGGYSIIESNQTQCFNGSDGVSCFPVLELVDALNKGIGFLPYSQQYFNVTFLLFTCNQTNRYTPIKFGYNPDDQSIRNSPFNPTFKTKMLVHGWTESYATSEWLEIMKNYILNQSCDYNVIILDWSSAGDLLNYFQAAANTRLVGNLAAKFINRLRNVTNTSPTNFQLVGQSLGAHVCGFAGALIQNPKLGEILGLDPAAPAFMLNIPNTRLDRTDAHLVNILHTNAGGLGLLANLGHYDFYANGGSIQPICTKNITLLNFTSINSIQDVLFCNHRQAHDYPTVTPNNTCQFIAYKCDNYQKFSGGQCADCGSDGEKCKPWEFNFTFWENSNNYRVDQAQPNQLYIKTGSDLQSLCLFHYQVVVYISAPISGSSGNITIWSNGQNPFTLSLNSYFVAGKQYYYLLTNLENLGRIESVNVKWTSSLNILGIPLGPKIKISQIQFNYMSNIDKSTRESFSSTLCQSPGQGIADGSSANFSICP